MLFAQDPSRSFGTYIQDLTMLESGQNGLIWALMGERPDLTRLLARYINQIQPDRVQMQHVHAWSVLINSGLSYTDLTDLLDYAPGRSPEP